MVPKGGLEPPRVAPHAPQTCASASSATSAREQGRSIPSTSTPAKPPDALAQPRIERVADPLAEQVVREHGQQDGKPRIDRQPPRELDDFLALVQDVAPRRVRRTHAEAEEGQARLGEDGSR